MGVIKSDDRNIFKILAIFLFIVILCLVGYIIFSGYDDGSCEINNMETESNLLDLSKLSDYKNYDGSYALIRRLQFSLEDGNTHYINMDMEGMVYVGFFAGKKKITNVNNAIDIVGLYSEFGFADESKCYILDKDGNVYVYPITNIFDNNYEAERIEMSDKVDKILSYTYVNEEGASSVSGVIAILENGDAVKLG